MARETVPAQLSTIQTIVSFVDLYQGHKASGDYSQNPGTRIIIYIDDILVMAPSREMAQQHTDCLIFLLEILGFTINRQKSLTDPSPEFEFVGLIADSIQM